MTVGTPNMWAVELVNFMKRYARGWTGRLTPAAVGPITLRLTGGQVLGLLGPNGSGKSTTMKALAGLTMPSAGTVQIFGHLSGSDAARPLVGYLPELPHFPTHLTGMEFLRYCAALSSMPPASAVTRIREVLRWSSLSAAAGLKIASYSKGMLQRLGLAQAILHDPPVILLDEPASGLDPAGRQLLRQLIRDLAQQGKTVVFSSHLLAQAEELCDRLAILGRGRLLIEGKTQDLVGAELSAVPQPSRLEKLYLEKIAAHE